MTNVFVKISIFSIACGALGAYVGGAVGAFVFGDPALGAALGAMAGGAVGVTAGAGLDS